MPVKPLISQIMQASAQKEVISGAGPQGIGWAWRVTTADKVRKDASMFFFIGWTEKAVVSPNKLAACISPGTQNLHVVFLYVDNNHGVAYPF